MNNLKNIVVNLKATGPAAFICIWIIAVMVLGLYGSGPYAGSALSILTIAGTMILVTLAQNTAAPERSGKANVSKKNEIAKGNI